MSNHRIIVAEPVPEYPAEPEEKFLTLPDISEEEIIETEQEMPPAGKEEPLFSEIPEPAVPEQGRRVEGREGPTLMSSLCTCAKRLSSPKSLCR